MSERIEDGYGNRILRGTWVLIGDDDDQPARVIEITDPDGDVDDDTGRWIFTPPRVIVEFSDEGETDRFGTRHKQSTDDVFVCDDLAVTNPPEAT